MREGGKNNVQHNASRNGKQERGTSQKARESTSKAKEKFPEAPDTVGMQDERGQKNRGRGKRRLMNGAIDGRNGEIRSK